MKLYDKKFLIFGNCMIRSFGQPGGKWRDFKVCATLRGQSVHFVIYKRIPQQARSVFSSFVISFSLIVPTNFKHVERPVQEYTDIKFCAYPVHSLAFLMDY